MQLLNGKMKSDCLLKILNQKSCKGLIPCIKTLENTLKLMCERIIQQAVYQKLGLQHTASTDTSDILAS